MTRQRQRTLQWFVHTMTRQRTLQWFVHTMTRQRTLQWFVHTMTRQRTLQWFVRTIRGLGSLAHDVMQGIVEGARGRGRVLLHMM